MSIFRIFDGGGTGLCGAGVGLNLGFFAGVNGLHCRSGAGTGDAVFISLFSVRFSNIFLEQTNK
jgi:hypothetical protein